MMTWHKRRCSECWWRKLRGSFFLYTRRAAGGKGMSASRANPLREDRDAILRFARFNREAAPNIMVKIPVTPDGLLAIEELAAERVPINATEVMSVRQTLDVCEVYTRAIRGLHAPPRCIFPISPASSMNISQRVPYGMASIFPRTTCGRRVLRWLKKSTRPFGKTRRPWALSAAAPVGCTTLPKWLAARRLLPSTGRVPRKN
ncbi:transaldolase family protein [Ruthenibacterium lactatiformans]|uniref:transaldolase family protein n=1 Tax=Ruthenibacterium lactatiformans TaxID=1550024 RepID=UPI003D7698D5